jgi:nucleotide-binding universal stress UspA family protein
MNASVIVGFDGSAPARVAVRYAADEALRRGCDLYLFHAFGWPLIYPPFGGGYDPHDRGPRVATQDLLAQTARDVEQEQPNLSVHTRLVDGSPGGVLVEASREAELLVVGHRGLGGFTGLLAGSVGIQAAGHALCPVVVVRGGIGSSDAPSCWVLTDRPGHASPLTRRSCRPNIEAPNCWWCIVDRHTPAGRRPRRSRRVTNLDCPLWMSSPPVCVVSPNAMPM